MCCNLTNVSLMSIVSSFNFAIKSPITGDNVYRYNHIIQIYYKMNGVSTLLLGLMMNNFGPHYVPDYKITSEDSTKTPASAHKQNPADSLEKELKEAVVSSKAILGSKFRARNRTGSAYFLSPQEMKKFNYTDINRMLKSVPGVNMYEEDGYGLRPNISMRGTKAERSERITLMEDGVLISPAPYSAPAAYYFPNAARMNAVEVLKGSSQVQYGPFTTGGAINMLSTPIPNRLAGKVDLSYGINNTWKGHAHIGNTYRNFGYMVEYLRYQSDGFKHYADHHGDGFTRNDFIAKVMVKTNRYEGFNHQLEMKYGYADENSDETYLGLSSEDFHKDHYLRYFGSLMDNMKTKHHQYVMSYVMKYNYDFKLTSDVYFNKFHRNWYKLNEVRVGDDPKEKLGISNILDDPETNKDYFDIITGKTDRIGDALMVRANNRSYVSRGVQAKAEHTIWINHGKIDNEIGGRYHYDEEDRFQWDDSYSMVNNQMILYRPGIHGTQANRITSAKTYSLYLLSKLKYKDWTINAGLRYEDIRLLKKDYTAEDLDRTGKVREETPNDARALIPSVGVNYQINKYFSAFAGMHKGFAPPSAEWYQKPESSINSEVGLRYFDGRFRFEVIGFYNDYKHMLGSDLAASGGTGSLDQFNVGKAKIGGLESLFNGNLLPDNLKWKLPVQLSYTFTDTEIGNDFESSSWGVVKSGDEIPYIYKHTFNAQLGVNYKFVEFNLGVNYKSDMRTIPGQGAIAESEKIPSVVILDASLQFNPIKSFTFYVNAMNLTNKRYLASRHPSGLRAGHPFGFTVGCRYNIGM